MEAGFTNHRAGLSADTSRQDCLQHGEPGDAAPVLLHLLTAPSPLLLSHPSLCHVSPQSSPGSPWLLLSVHGNTVQQVTHTQYRIGLFLLITSKICQGNHPIPLPTDLQSAYIPTLTLLAFTAFLLLDLFTTVISTGYEMISQNKFNFIHRRERHALLATKSILFLIQSRSSSYGSF